MEDGANQSCAHSKKHMFANICQALLLDLLTGVAVEAPTGAAPAPGVKAAQGRHAAACARSGSCCQAHKAAGSGSLCCRV